MDREEFTFFRKRMSRTQESMSRLLGISVKAVRSYEQGWRQIPAYVERQVLFLAALKENPCENRNPCWDIMQCPGEKKKLCPAWEFQAGDWCWAINGTVCGGAAQENWEEKMKICRDCKAFPPGLRHVST